MRELFDWQGTWSELFRGPSLWTLCALLVCVAASAWVNEPSPWAGYTLGQAGLIYEYCERNRMGALIRQPLNSWSNFVYLWVALVFLRFAAHDRARKEKGVSAPNLLSHHPILTVVFAGFAYLLFVGSFLYHASLLYVSQKLDMSGTFGAMFCVLAYAFLRLWPVWLPQAKTWSEKIYGAVFGGTVGLLVIYFNFFWHLEEVIPAALVPPLTCTMLLIYSLKTKHTHRWRWLFAAFALSQIAYLFRQLDVAKILCLPNSLIWQGHALWHILTGLAWLTVYCFFRTERPVSLPDEEM